MMSGSRFATCKDPLVQSLRDQGDALKLLELGLRPKQVAIITNLSNRKVNQLRGGLMSAADRVARPPLSVGTILRQADLRAAASFFFSVYERVTAGRASDGPDWVLFLQSYEIYANQSSIIANGFDETWSILPIEDACTLVMALGQGEFEPVLCEQHGIRYLTMPNHHRSWRCPYCTRADRKKPSNGEAVSRAVARTEPDFGVRAGNSDDDDDSRFGA
jgi:hypothetical protein